MSGWFLRREELNIGRAGNQRPAAGQDLIGNSIVEGILEPYMGISILKDDRIIVPGLMYRVSSGSPVGTS